MGLGRTCPLLGGLFKLPARQVVRDLQKHVEGGYFAINYKTQEMVVPLNPRYHNAASNANTENHEKITRAAGSSIYFLLEKNDFSALHRLKSDEIWHYYDGSPVTLHVIDKNGKLKSHVLGNPLSTENASFQVLIEAGNWFAAEISAKNSFGLVGCTVSPGFEYDDFELADRKQLITQYPHYTSIISRLTRTAPIESNLYTPKLLGYSTLALAAGIGFFTLAKQTGSFDECVNNIKRIFGMQK